MEKWLEFRVEKEECQHDQDQYDGCPLCEIEEKDKLLDELEKALAICESEYRKADKQIAELKAEIAKAYTELNMQRSCVKAVFNREVWDRAEQRKKGD